MGPIDALETPFVAVEMDVMEANLRAMADRAKALGLRLRPHTKTHKQPDLAWQQRSLGAPSLTVAKLDEAAVMLAAGLDDLLIAYPLVGTTKAHRLAGLMMKGLSATVAIDSLDSLRTASHAGVLAGRPVTVLVEVDTGFHRCGVSGSAVLELALAAERAPGVQLAGIMSFAGHIAGQTQEDAIVKLIRAEDDLMGQYANELHRAGLCVDIISVGGTILAHHMEHIRYANEVRPGIYIFNDMGIVRSGSVQASDCALRIWTTVVSCPAEDRLILDAGSKTLSSDGPLDGGYGYVVDRPGWQISRLTEEHGIVTLEPSAIRARVGERIAIIPNHVCTVVNLHDKLVGIRNSTVTSLLPIEARGGIR